MTQPEPPQNARADGKRPSVLIFVDLPGRDLMGDALIAHELGKLGIDCHLEPLQSWQAGIYAYEPDFVLYNHLTSEKLADYSQELRGYGVLVGCLLNEGLVYENTAREFVSKPQYDNIHCDLFLCWNDAHRDALIERAFCSPSEMARTVGCPRFDFYKEPWRRVYEAKLEKKDARPVILVNATFVLAHFQTLPKENADRFFEPWKDKIANLTDYMALVKAHFDSRGMLPGFLEELLQTGSYRIILRPHPREELAFYHDWLATLPAERRELITLEERARENPPFSSIIAADVVVNCEDCTTAMEAWLADKPTVTIALTRHPFCFTETYTRLSPLVETPATLVAAVEEALESPQQEAYSADRKEHLDRWLGHHEGDSARRAALEIKGAIEARGKRPEFPKRFGNLRKALKLRFLHMFNEPYTFQPKHYFRNRRAGREENLPMKFRSYLKSIRPSDVAEARRTLRQIDPATQPQGK